jgi:hypothetical protein
VPVEALVDRVGAPLHGSPPLPGRVWAYDLDANTWIQKGPAPSGVALGTYDPVSGLVVAANAFTDAIDLWTYVVMFHGAPGGSPESDRADLGEEARRVAQLGFVVFSASWGHSPAAVDMSWYDGGLALGAQGACAVEFARMHAAAYGGDPATMIVFGHSGGGTPAAMVAFARPKPTAGCLGGATLGGISALVTWEGNWVLSPTYPDWNAIVAEDPRVMDLYTPWK